MEILRLCKSRGCGRCPGGCKRYAARSGDSLSELAVNRGRGAAFARDFISTKYLVRNIFRRRDAERERARAAARELEQRAVLRDEHVRARGERGLEEDLVVGVAAARQAGALGGSQLVLDAPREPARLRKRGGLRGGGNAVAAEVVGEDALELGVAGRIHEDLRTVLLHRGAKGTHAGVIEHQPVEPDLSIEDESQGVRAPSPNYCAVQPPSITRLVPVRSDAAGEAAKTTAAATSSGVPALPAGMRASTHWANSGFSRFMRW